MRIVVDAFGGDNAPVEIIKGAAAAHKEYGVDITLVGDKVKIDEVINDNNLDFSESLIIVDSSDVISMHDDPTSILKSHNECSMAKAFYELRDGNADAFVSAGSTGAIVVGGTLIVKRLKGVKRPALGSMIPAPEGSYMLMDINKDYSEQGFKDKAYDVILCANVLHNSHNIGENLSKLKKLLKDDGYIIIIEATRESCLLTTSLELKGGLEGFTDHRRGGIDVFTSEDKWIELIKEAGFTYHFTLPERHDPLAECGQSVFLCGNDAGVEQREGAGTEAGEGTDAGRKRAFLSGTENNR